MYDDGYINKMNHQYLSMKGENGKEMLKILVKKHCLEFTLTLKSVPDKYVNGKEILQQPFI